MKTKSIFLRLASALLALTLGATAVALAFQDGAATARRLEQDFHRAVELMNARDVDRAYDMMVRVANQAQNENITLDLEVERGLREYLSRTRDYWRQRAAGETRPTTPDTTPTTPVTPRPVEADPTVVQRQLRSHYTIADSYVKENRHAAAAAQLEQLRQLMNQTGVRPDAALQRDIDGLMARLREADIDVAEFVPPATPESPVTPEPPVTPPVAAEPAIDPAVAIRERLAGQIDQAAAALDAGRYDEALRLTDAVSETSAQTQVALNENEAVRLATIRERAGRLQAERLAAIAGLEARYRAIEPMIEDGRYDEARQALIAVANDAAAVGLTLSRDVELGMRRDMTRIAQAIEARNAAIARTDALLREAEARNEAGRYGEALDALTELDRLAAEHHIALDGPARAVRNAQRQRAEAGIAQQEQHREWFAYTEAQWALAADQIGRGNHDEGLAVLEALKAESQRRDAPLPGEMGQQIDGRIAGIRAQAQRAAQINEQIDGLLAEASNLQQQGRHADAVQVVEQTQRLARDNNMELTGQRLAHANGILRESVAAQQAQQDEAQRRDALARNVGAQLAQADKQLEQGKAAEALETLRQARAQQQAAGLELDDATARAFGERLAAAESQIEAQQAIAALSARLADTVALRERGQVNAALDALQALERDAAALEATPQELRGTIAAEVRATEQEIERLLAREREQKIADALADTRDVQTLEQQVSAARARKFLADARQAMREVDYTAARELLEKAKELDPANPDIQNELNALQAMIGRDVSDYDALLEDSRQRLALQRTQSLQQINRLINQARQAEFQPRPDYDRAIELYQTVLDRVAASPLEAGERREIAQRTEGMLAQARVARQRYAEARAEATQREALERYRREHDIAELTQEEEINRIFSQALRYIENENFTKALEQYERVLRSSPTPDQREKAMYLRGLVRDLYLEASNTAMRLAQEEHYASEMLRTSGMTIPWHDTWRFPDDWMELSRRRIERVREEQLVGPESEATVSARRRLEEVWDFPAYENQPVREIINTIRDRTGLNIHWSFNAREYWDVPISNLPLRNTSYAAALRTYLDHGMDLELDFIIKDGLIWVVTRDEAEGAGYIQVYDILDLIVPDPDYTDTNLPSFDLQDNLRDATGRTTTGGRDQAGQTGGGLFGGGQQGGQTRGFEGADIGEESQRLQDMLRRTVRGEDFWGFQSSLNIERGRLMVMAPRRVQEEIQDLLRKLRQIRSMQVTVDLRNIYTTRYFAEVIGIEWTGPIVDNPNPPPDTVQTPGVNLRRQPVFGNVFVTPFSILRGATSAALTATSSIITPSGLSGDAGLIATGAILDDVQLFFLVRAVSGSTHSRTMRAPRVTVMNGQLAYLVQATTQDFVANINSEPTVASGAVQTTGTTAVSVGRVQIGTNFQLRPTISWDRRYVKMDLVSHFTDLLQFRQYPYLEQVGDDIVETIIQQPEIQNLRFRTTVSVPDRGTVIVGGLNQAFQTDTESAIPLLGQLPILRRLFANQAMGRDREVTILLVRPEIVIQEERDPYEAQLGVNP